MKGFTVVELIVSIGIISIFLTLVLPNMLSPQHRSAYTEAITALSSDLREQQSKAMLREGSLSATPSAYGIYFGTDDYVLFKGPVYSPTAADNFKIDLDYGISFSAIGFPDSQIVFDPGSGEAGNFSADSYTITVGDSSEGIGNIITVDRYGTATQIN
jgi:prepilin-type N-terminal cleavage/methylation domain-containing protein